MSITNIELIKAWAKDRALDTADPKKQIFKLMEETGELAAGIARGNKDLIEDSIGDIFVVQTILLMQVGKDITESNAFAMYEVDLKAENESDNESMNEIFKAIAAIGLELELMGGRSSGNFYGADQVATIIYHTHNIAENHGLDLSRCIGMAYDEIKDRKGKMVDGVFVKEADLQ